MIDLRYADKLDDLEPMELTLELVALAEATKFDYRLFIKTIHAEDNEPGRALFSSILDAWAATWFSTMHESETHIARVWRWKVITA